MSAQWHIRVGQARRCKIVHRQRQAKAVKKYVATVHRKPSGEYNGG